MNSPTSPPPPPATTRSTLDERLHAGPGEWIALEDFAPLPRCLEWRLSRAFWNVRGPAAFFGGEVPYAAINDGRLSADAARLFAEICGGEPPRPLRVLEVGGGSGLFARFFLDELRLRSPALYAATTYVWTDASPAMVNSAAEFGVFAEHSGRVHAQVVPVPGLAALGAEAEAGFDLIIANYLLDNLPATLLRISNGVTEELEIRATLRADLPATRLGGHTAREWAERLRRGEALEAELVELYPMFSLECRHRPVDRRVFKFEKLIPESSPAAVLRWSHHEAAWTWLQEVLPHLRPGGGVLVNDYGHFPMKDEKRYDAFQHFGGSLANGLNLDELGRFPLMDGAWAVTAPETDSKQVQSRWIGHAGDQLSAGLFRLVFDGARRDRVMDLLTQAQAAADNGRVEEARWLFWQSRELAPRCWYVYERWALFCLAKLQDYPSALGLAETGLKLHPRHPLLWNAKGDACYELKQFAEAEACYRRTLEINPREIRGRLNLAYVFLETGRCAEVLKIIAEALALDPQGEYREAVLEKQRQVLLRLSLDARDALTQQLNRFRNLDAPGNAPAPAAGP